MAGLLHALGTCFQAQPLKMPCTLGVTVIGDFKVCPWPESPGASMQKDKTNYTVQQQTRYISHGRKNKGRRERETETERERETERKKEVRTSNKLEKGG